MRTSSKPSTAHYHLTAVLQVRYYLHSSPTGEMLLLFLVINNNNKQHCTVNLHLHFIFMINIYEFTFSSLQFQPDNHWLTFLIIIWKLKFILCLILQLNIKYFSDFMIYSYLVSPSPFHHSSRQRNSDAWDGRSLAEI